MLAGWPLSSPFRKDGVTQGTDSIPTYFFPIMLTLSERPVGPCINRIRKGKEKRFMGEGAQEGGNERGRPERRALFWGGDGPEFNTTPFGDRGVPHTFSSGPVMQEARPRPLLERDRPLSHKETPWVSTKCRER